MINVTITTPSSGVWNYTLSSIVQYAVHRCLLHRRCLVPPHDDVRHEHDIVLPAWHGTPPSWHLTLTAPRRLRRLTSSTAESIQKTKLLHTLISLRSMA